MAHCSSRRSDLRSAVYEAIDASITLERCLPAAVASVQRALVHAEGDVEAVRQLESMSVHLHQLTAATMRSEENCRREAIVRLSKLADQWMANLPMQ